MVLKPNLKMMVQMPALNLQAKASKRKKVVFQKVNLRKSKKKTQIRLNSLNTRKTKLEINLSLGKRSLFQMI